MRLRDRLHDLVLLCLCLGMGWWLWEGVAAIDDPEYIIGPAAYYLVNTVRETGAANVVAAILFDYRGIDTLGEATVIFTTVCGVAMLFSKSRYKKSSAGLSFIARRGLSFVMPFLFMYGSAIILMGHLSPGGGFQGGAVFATITILFCIVFGSSFEASRINPKTKETIESLGGILFIFIGGIGLLAGAGFLANIAAGFPRGQLGSFLSAGTIPLLNVAVGMKVGAGLSTIFYSMVRVLELEFDEQLSEVIDNDKN
ncbi:hydrogen gas-evolving membrane-bound hydrogenase subunit E [Thermovirga lienii]|uniref:hydrogen gas-evolving membrane-bound hydrogenase subunit E n=1 Tax=Thermovirga lienii TaxID=336261 RepID=UPI000ED94E72|nr:sodium:proton antiporter [Thermovirga lienii]